MIREGHTTSREKAKELIQTGRVSVDGQTVRKAGTFVDPSQTIQVQAEECPYVSRGGYKLARALDVFEVNPTGWICLDAGASTGGFTDCLLQHGASLVYALDVGIGQLHEKLRRDPRVIGREKVNVRYLTEDEVPCLCDLAVADLSYISLTKVLPALWNRVKPDGAVICLVKPQFEAGPGAVDKHGVIKDPRVHRRVLEAIAQFSDSHGWALMQLTYSPIRGPEGNIEYLLYLKSRQGGPSVDGLSPNEVAVRIANIVSKAHQTI
jgi:23S rRNA (cytidine1920-2'-O)/16S rRNA (cytidine1409-2'-O)-methyltransferase